MKKSIFIPLLLFGIVLTGCTTTTIPTTTPTNKTIQDDLFQKKQQCAGLTNELIEKTRLLEIEFPTLWKFSFEQVFYSPIKNSCLWVRRATRDSERWSYSESRNLYEYWDDSWSSDPIAGCRTYVIVWENMVRETDTDCDQFDIKILELKWE